MKRIASVFLLLFCGVLQAQPPRSYTSSEILLQLKKLNTVGSVLYIAAHPDDENTRLIAYLANEKCLRTGYLSLTRGDGGQNLIGPEQGVELGVIRTQELLAARRIDGGEQFFTRAYDFGYSKTPEETFKNWNKDSVLSDVVWVIRNFRPDIIITRFATDGSGGHGHHTASAILAEEAFDAAGDPKRFPEQLQHVDVWQPRRLFYNATNRFRDPNADMSAFIKLDVGGYNPLLGKSYGEIAAESRSMHKSQGFGSAKQRGEYFEYFKPVKGDTVGLKDIFEGIDFTWKRLPWGKAEAELIKQAITQYENGKQNQAILSLVNAQKKLLIDVQKSNKRYENYGWVWQKLDDCVGNMCGLYQDVLLPEYSTCSGQVATLQLIFINRSQSDIEVKLCGFSQPFGSIFRPYRHEMNLPLPTNQLCRDSASPPVITSNEGYGLSMPYWLRHPLSGGMFTINNPREIGRSQIVPQAILSTYIHNVPFNFYVPIQHKWVDPEKGELYRPLVITPPVMINIQDEVLVFNDNQPKEIRIVLKAGKDSVSGELSWYTKDLKPLIDPMKQQFKAEDFFDVLPDDFVFNLAKKGDEKEFVFKIKPVNQFKISEITFLAKVNGAFYSKGIKEIKYDHIPIQTLFPEAEIKLIRLDVKKKLKRIGYIPGAGDEVAPCLTQLGYEVIMLTDDVLAKENLNQFEAILTGVRAYNTNEKLPSFKQKLMDYMANGGNLIVQYNTNSWAGPLSSDIGPYKFKITRERITDEEAKVNFELPNHPVMNTPNKITDKDFEGWIQERSIYHAGDWDSNYVAPLSMADPGEKNNKGALIIAKHGKGHFVYSGLVFFRQLPAGVPGAYRLLVNMIELGK